MFSLSVIPFIQKSSICSLSHSIFYDIITSALTSPRGNHFSVANFHAYQWIFSSIFSKSPLFTLLSRNSKPTNTTTISSPREYNTWVDIIERLASYFLYLFPEQPVSLGLAESNAH